ncbi:TPA: DUF1492 domain-containing protein [Streptococcus suis]
MHKKPTRANQLLHELRVIPKLITALKQDIEKTRSSVLTSPQWSDMKVQGGIRKSQEDGNIAIIDATEYNVAEIGRLLRRKEEIIQIIRSMPDMILSHVLIVTYVTCNSYEEAMEYLGIHNRNKYYMLKRKAEESLNLILNDTDLILNDTKKYCNK